MKTRTEISEKEGGYGDREEDGQAKMKEETEEDEVWCDLIMCCNLDVLSLQCPFETFERKYQLDRALAAWSWRLEERSGQQEEGCKSNVNSGMAVLRTAHQIFPALCPLGMCLG